MKIRSLALASLFILPIIVHAQFADSIAAYTPGDGVSASYTNASRALGAPTTFIGYQNSDPFNSPYASSQLVSVGTGGSLTLQFSTPIVNDSANPFGLDFIIFGNSGFAITNGNYSGGGITDGSLYGANPGATRVSVSADGVNFYTLNPALAPTVDQYFPADSAGDFLRPINPALTAANFSGLDLTGIRSLYSGSGGGAGYNLAWAQDTNGNFVSLPIASYVRIQVLSGKSEVDAVAKVRGSANIVADNFVNNPLANGWKIFGNTNLFHWNPTNQNVEVTWDSTNANSYLARPLGTVLTRDDAFSVSFDLQLNDAVAFNYGQQLAVGLLNWAQATNASFSRSGGTAPNLFEFDYFPDTGFGDSIDATLIDTNTGFTYFYFAYDNRTLAPGLTYQIILSHAAGTTNLTGEIRTNGVLFTTLPFTYAGPITDFRLDTLAISSYADDGFGDSILAHGTVKNFIVTLPPSPIQNLTGRFSAGQWQAQFLSRSNWLYTLERSADLKNWSAAAPAVSGNGTNVITTDAAPPADKSFYRLHADRP